MNQKTHKVDPFLVIAAICTAINGALRINMWVVRTRSVSIPATHHTDASIGPLQLHLSGPIWGHLRPYYSTVMDPSGPALRPSVCRLRNLRCLLRCSFTCIPCPRNSKDAVSHQPLHSRPSGRKSLVWRRIYCNTIHTGRGRFERRMVSPECLHWLYRNWECLTCTVGDLCNLCRVPRRVSGWRIGACICWRSHHYVRNVLSLLSLHDCRSFFIREVGSEQGSSFLSFFCHSSWSTDLFWFTRVLIASIGFLWWPVRCCRWCDSHHSSADLEI